MSHQSRLLNIDRLLEPSDATVSVCVSDEGDDMQRARQRGRQNVS